MKPISECKWEVIIDCIPTVKEYWWYATTKDKSGFTCGEMVGNDYKTIKGALSNWKKFAEINGIKNWELK